MKKYLEIVEIGTLKVVVRVDVTHKSERQIERTKRGMMMNSNLDKFFVAEVESEEELETKQKIY